MVRLLNTPEASSVSVKKGKGGNLLSKEYEDLRHHLSKHFSVRLILKEMKKGLGKLLYLLSRDEELERIIALLDNSSK